MLQKDIGWNEIEYGNIVTAFQAAYAVGLFLCGRIVDVYGAAWSCPLQSHSGVSRQWRTAWASTVVGFIYARIFLGLGESANFPSAVKVTAEWFPKEERAFATAYLMQVRMSGMCLHRSLFHG